MKFDMNQEEEWVKVAEESDFDANIGGCVLLNGVQIAVLNTDKTKWYAVDNCCSHKGNSVLARGIIGDAAGEPKISCPLHKRSFSLITGKCLNDDLTPLRVYGVRSEKGGIYVRVSDGRDG